VARDFVATRLPAAIGRVIATVGSPHRPVIGGAGAPPLSFSNGTFRLSFATQSGTSCTIQYKNSLSDATWTDLQTVTGTGGNVTITEATGGPMRFYRLILP
jgi:hypothetical protein